MNTLQASPTAAASGIGELIRETRQQRRLSQMDLALDVGISPRHLSFVETGRSKPSAEVLLAIAERLALPLRTRNVWLLAALQPGGEARLGAAVAAKSIVAAPVTDKKSKPLKNLGALPGKIGFGSRISSVRAGLSGCRSVAWTHTSGYPEVPL